MKRPVNKIELVRFVNNMNQKPEHQSIAQWFCSWFGFIDNELSDIKCDDVAWHIIHNRFM